MVIFKLFFLQNLQVTDITFFCHRRKQNYRIRNSYRTFNARQREIPVEPVSVPLYLLISFLFIES